METLILFITALSWVAVILGGCVWGIGLFFAALSAWAGEWLAAAASLWIPFCVSLFPLLGAVWLWVSP